MQIPDSVLSYRRSRILLIAAVMVAIIALIDWKVTTEMSFGFLYFFPIFLAAGCLRQWEIAVLAAGCTFLREAFGPFDRTYMFSRLFLAWGSFTAAGWLVRGVLANWQKVREQLIEIRSRDRLLRDSEEQLRVLVETSSAAILTLDKTGTVIQANGAATRLFGDDQRVLVGQSIENYLPSLARVPSDQSAPVFRTTMECEGKRRNGETFLANVCFSTHQFSGESRLTAVITETEPSISEAPENSGDIAQVLTQLEHMVLRGIFEGRSNKEIAAGLETSESAVKSTIQRLFAKLGARTRSQLVIIAIERLGRDFYTAQAANIATGDQKIAAK
jgi:two-component system sensor kinase FixL